MRNQIQLHGRSLKLSVSLKWQVCLNSFIAVWPWMYSYRIKSKNALALSIPLLSPVLQPKLLSWSLTSIYMTLHHNLSFSIKWPPLELRNTGISKQKITDNYLSDNIPDNKIICGFHTMNCDSMAMYVELGNAGFTDLWPHFSPMQRTLVLIG